MKKVFTVLIALFMIFTIFPLNTSARTHIDYEGTNEVENKEFEEMNIVQITDKDGIQLSDGSYIIDPTVLVGTSLEGEKVIVRDDGVYINDIRSNQGVRISIGDEIIGWLVEGVITYVSEYRGDKLTATTVSMIVNFLYSHPEVIIVAILLFTLTGDTVQAYETADGNECVLNPSGHGYVCKYSV